MTLQDEWLHTDLSLLHCGAYDITGLMATYNFKLVYSIAVHMTLQEQRLRTIFSATHNFLSLRTVLWNIRHYRINGYIQFQVCV